jgi:hypothetical protein
MKKQIKFSIEEINQIVGKYVVDNKLLGETNSVDMLFHHGYGIDDSYIIVSER